MQGASPKINLQHNFGQDVPFSTAAEAWRVEGS